MDSVKKAQVAFLHRLSFGSLLLSYVSGVVFVIAYWELIGAVTLLSWLSFLTVITFGRSYLVYLYTNSPKRQERPEFWIKIYCFGTLLGGLTWGMLGLQFDSTWPSIYQIILFTMLAGLIAGAVGSHSSYFPALATFYTPILVSMTWVAVSQDDPAFLWLVPLILVFWAIIHLGGMRFSRILQENIRIQKTLEEANEKLEVIAKIDPLTQLNNRTALSGYLDRIWRDCASENKEVAIAMIDVDYFKAYNDTYGHVEGDRCLFQVANLIKAAVPPKAGFLARYGGEEFIVVLPGVSLNTAYLLVDKIMQALQRETIMHEASSIAETVTLSIGLAMAYPSVISDWNLLVDQADSNLYLAKQRGRARIVGPEELTSK